MIELTGWVADGFKGNLSLVLSDRHGGNFLPVKVIFGSVVPAPGGAASDRPLTLLHGFR